jgi:hypothetical protein
MPRKAFTGLRDTTKKVNAACQRHERLEACDACGPQAETCRRANESGKLGMKREAAYKTVKTVQATM